MEISKLNPIRFGDGQTFDRFNGISKIRGHQYLADIKKTQGRCFLSSVAYFFKCKDSKSPLDATDPTYTKFISELNLDGIPKSKAVQLRHIRKFVKINPSLGLKINILSLEDGDIYPFETSIGSKGKNVLNLLSVPTQLEGDRRHLINHILPIKNINSFLSQREERKNGGKVKYRHRNCHLCMECFQTFRTKFALSQHRELCQNPRGQKIKMAKPGEVMEFTNHFKKFHTGIRG